MKSEIVKQWVKSNKDLGEIIAASKENKLPVAQAITKLLQFNALNVIEKDTLSEYELSEARQFAQTIFNDETKYDRHLFTLFLLTWAETAIHASCFIEAETLLKEINQKKLEQPILKAMIINAFGVIGSFTGNKFDREVSINKCIRIIPKDSPHFESILIEQMAFLGSMGRYKEYQFDDYPLKSKEAQIIKLKSKLGNCVQTFQSNEYKILSGFIATQSKEIQSEFSQKKIKANMSLIDSHQYTQLPTFDLEDKDLSLFQKLQMTTTHLFNGQGELALSWAKRLIKDSRLPTFLNNLVMYVLIRAEISNKNISAASNLMANKDKNGGAHYLDDLFNARISLLKGNTKKATELFQNTFRYCLYYEATNRFCFEIDVSAELSNRDKNNIIKNCLNLKPKLFKPIAATDLKSSKDQNAFIGQSEPIMKLKKIVKKLSDANTNILITGETGVGKEVVAKSLHQQSQRADNAFLTINCGAIAESLLYSELFGHRKGSYTGAISEHKGIFEAAGKGTVLLDEIGEISENVQVSLLRILESNEVKPIGSSKSKKIHCQIIAATNKDLTQLVKQGQFREDLYYRLNRLEIIVPPLREREGDVLLLAKHYFALNRTDKQKIVITPELQKAMLQYPWPGNIRQLKNEIEKMRFLYSEKTKYQISDFKLVNTEPQQIGNLAKTETPPPITSNQIPINSLEAILTNVLSNERTPLRRRQKIKELFLLAKTLTRGEIVKVLNVAPGTIVTDLKMLEAENFIKKIKPSASTRSHFYQLL